MHHHHHNHHRRRKKRPNYGTRTVEVCRGINGFGFTISGQQPCILSCIVSNSPADLAGLRAGNFLISVNGLNVSKLPHEAVVHLIGTSPGNIKMTIAENYYSDSSDEDNILVQQNYHRIRHKYPNQNSKGNNVGGTSKCNSGIHNNKNHQHHRNGNHESNKNEKPPQDNGNILSRSNISNSNPIHPKDITNVRAMVRINNDSNIACSSNSNEHGALGGCIDSSSSSSNSLEYRAIVGYLGTIEMPKQIATSSKLQTVRSCIRKMRQEKRNPTNVLMTILPNQLTLKNNHSVVIAKYPSSRLNYVSSSSENNDNKFFGLVTSQIYTDGGQIYNDNNPHDIIASQSNVDVHISNSCHVFVIDTKLCDHINHLNKANLFQIVCTKDPISNLCLEFPNNSEYVVNLIRSMYTLKSAVKLCESKLNNHKLLLQQNRHNLNNPRGGIDDNFNDLIMSNSPQPSEITTTSSNSDSGIGFHNDLSNISDRIVVVDFPRQQCLGPNQNKITNNCNKNTKNPRPVGIINDVSLESIKNIRCKIPINPESRLTVRAMPDPRVEQLNIIQESAIDVPKIYETIFFNNNIVGTRSCDDMIVNYTSKSCSSKGKISSSENLSGNMESNHLPSSSSSPIKNQRNNDHIFLLPTKPVSKKLNSNHTKKMKKVLSSDDSRLGLSTTKNLETDKLLSYKLCPKVFGVPRPISISYENLTDSGHKNYCDLISVENSGIADNDGGSIWGSLQEIRLGVDIVKPTIESMLEGTYSEPDLRIEKSRSLNPGTSPFRRWGQSSLRSRTTNEPRTPLSRRPSSLAASENDVYTKSDDSSGQNNNNDGININNNNNNFDSDIINGKYGPSTWSTSFEKLLSDPSGIHTFSEFLKKEFSAENIYFWTACERYTKINDSKEREKEAIAIFTRHLAVGAPEPVNVDSQARNTTQEHLQNADRNLFLSAQKQIFNLMKFDSYARFIRSDLYKQCLDAEEKNQALPYPGGEQLDVLLKTGIQIQTPTKLKKSLSNADDRRRKSLLPWHRKARCKSKDRDDCAQLVNKTNNGRGSIGSGSGLKIANSGSDIHSSRSSLSSFDAAISSRNNIDSDDHPLCRVLLSDGASTIVSPRGSETIRDLIERVLEKRGICYQAYEAFLSGNNKPIELDSLATCLARKEIQIEQRVIFKLDLPNRKVISVKSKPCKALGEVLRPILHKYNFKLDLVQVFFRESAEPLDMTLPVTVTDGQRLQVVCKPTEVQTEIAQISTSLNSGNLIQKVQKTIISHPISPSNSNLSLINSQNLVSFNNKTLNVCNKTTQTQQTTLDEITNKVFNELLQGKCDPHLTQPPRASDQGSTKSDDWGSESSSGIFGRLRNRGEHNYRINKLKKSTGIQCKSSTTGSEDGNDGVNLNIGGNAPNIIGSSNVNSISNSNNNLKKPLIAKWKAGVKLQVTARSENHDLLEGLKRAQRSRLEDQRGTEINFELPDFLKDKENNIQNHKLRKLKENTSSATQGNEPIPYARSIIDESMMSCLTSLPVPSNTSTDSNLSVSIRPKPAPRLSITSKNNNNCHQQQKATINNSPIRNDLPHSLDDQHSQHKFDFNSQHINTDDKSSTNSSFHFDNQMESSFNSLGTITYEDGYAGAMASSVHEDDFVLCDDGNGSECNGYISVNLRGPPPLPPKPKILPIKPSNWGQKNNSNIEVFKIPQEMPRRLVTNNNNNYSSNNMDTNNSAKTQRTVYLDQPSSSFV